MFELIGPGSGHPGLVDLTTAATLTASQPVTEMNEPTQEDGDNAGQYPEVTAADGTAAFFFCNAVDDARMGVTYVLRGEDHLANTPRQLMILSALDLAAPHYGHVSLLVGPDGAPLSKRHGATSVREYRERGFAAAAVINHLFRLGHATAEHGFLSLAQMAQAFDPTRLGRAPARFDEQQLLVWQKDAVHRMDEQQLRAWLGPVLPAGLDESAVNAGAKLQSSRAPHYRRYHDGAQSIYRSVLP